MYAAAHVSPMTIIVTGPLPCTSMGKAHRTGITSMYTGAHVTTVTNTMYVAAHVSPVTIIIPGPLPCKGNAHGTRVTCTQEHM